jgi:hypothetical protein
LTGVVNIGAVFHDPDFVFQDGERGNKLFIVLAATGKVCIVARTTSKPSGKSRSYGCHHDDRFPNFFIPREAGIFREDTWICLDYLVEFIQTEFEQKTTNDNIRKITELSRGLLLDLLQCAIDSDDVTENQERALQETLGQLKANGA